MEIIWTALGVYFGLLLYHNDTLSTIVMWLLIISAIVIWFMSRGDKE